MEAWNLDVARTAGYYQSRSIHRLIPLLDSEDGSESLSLLLPTTVLLRCMEQFSEPDEDAQCHMSGAFTLFTRSRDKWSPNQVDVEGVSFWIAVRQSLRICFLFEQECNFPLGIVDDTGMFDGARDDIWTNRMTYLLARVCRACWSPDYDGDQQKAELQDNSDALDSWRRHLPKSFEPWFYEHHLDSPFAQVRYFGRWHAIAWQKYYTARTMLAVYSQRGIATTSYHETTRYLNTEILPHARMACAVVFSEMEPGIGINGAHLAYWCAQFFSGKAEQRETLRWFNDFTESTKWPVRTMIERLQAHWNSSHGS